MSATPSLSHDVDAERSSFTDLVRLGIPSSRVSDISHASFEARFQRDFLR